MFVENCVLFIDYDNYVDCWLKFEYIYIYNNFHFIPLHLLYRLLIARIYCHTTMPEPASATHDGFGAFGKGSRSCCSIFKYIK